MEHKDQPFTNSSGARDNVFNYFFTNSLNIKINMNRFCFIWILWHIENKIKYFRQFIDHLFFAHISPIRAKLVPSKTKIHFLHETSVSYIHLDQFRYILHLSPSSRSTPEKDIPPSERGTHVRRGHWRKFRVKRNREISYLIPKVVISDIGPLIWAPKNISRRTWPPVWIYSLHLNIFESIDTVLGGWPHTLLGFLVLS